MSKISTITFALILSLNLGCQSPESAQQQQFTTLDSSPYSTSNIVSPESLHDFGTYFFVTNLHRETFGYDRITDVYPDTSKMAVYSIIETIREDNEHVNDIKLQILYSTYRLAKRMNRNQKEDFATNLYRITADATLTNIFTENLFTKFQMYDKLDDNSKMVNPALFKAFKTLNKRHDQ